MTYREHQKWCCSDVGHWLACEVGKEFSTTEWNSKTAATQNRVYAEFWKRLWKAWKVDKEIEVMPLLS